jgi:hypothetical protein
MPTSGGGIERYQLLYRPMQTRVYSIVYSTMGFYTERCDWVVREVVFRPDQCLMAGLEMVIDFFSAEGAVDAKRSGVEFIGFLFPGVEDIL